MSLLNSLIPTLGHTPANTSTDAQRSSDVGPTIKPLYEIKETPEAFGVTVYVPGVTKDALDLTAEEGQIRIVGRRGWKRPAEWTAVYRETSDAAFELVLSHDNAVDGAKIAAELRDGVLRVSLPKHEAVKPRKISVS